MTMSLPVFQRVFLLVILYLPATLPADGFASGLLWEIRDGKGATSYLLGTMHTEDKRVLDLPAPVARALDKSTSFTMEIELNDVVRQQMIAMMIYDDGHDLRAILGSSLYNKVADLMATYGTPQNVLRGMKPWAVMVTLSTPRPVTGRFLDVVLLETAVAQGKEVHGLETVQEQLAVFDDLPVDEQVTLLKDTVAFHSELGQTFEQMTRLYLARDLAGLQRLNEQHMQRGNAALSQKLVRRLIVDRNKRMVSRMQQQIRKGGAFIAVGALHLPGDQGILSLLQDKGYAVKPVY